MQANKTERNELIQQFRDTQCVATRDNLCQALSKYFDHRKDWVSRHKRSYVWALERGVIPRLQDNQKKKESRVAAFAKARDELHKFTVANDFDYYAEMYASEMLRRQYDSGNDILSALACAKAALESGMHKGALA